jgi:hypothetical protein
VDREAEQQAKPDAEEDRREPLAAEPHERYGSGMCRSIKTLRRADTAATTGEIEAAARQFIRKVSGYRTPSARNAEAFEGAIEDVAATASRLLAALGVDVEEGPDRWTPGSGRAHAHPHPIGPGT